jgi:hypothetical protein
MKANVLNAGKIYPGMKYQRYESIMTRRKNLYREIVQPSAGGLRLLWRVLRKVVVAKRAGQIIAEG